MKAGFGFLGFIILALTTTQAMDLARREARVDQAIKEFGVTGKGVLVAIMDRGIDWQNADFRHEDGTTRIEAMFDLTDDRGAQKDNPHKMGTIYTKKEINEALRHDSALAMRDKDGHGTTTAGIVAGNGRNCDGKKYRGVAPNASLLVIKICTDETPAYGQEKREKAFYEPDRIPVAIDFIREKARELRMPCVMLLNLGSQGGPTDGTSELCRKIDAAVGPGIAGMVFVTGPGDDGGRDNRAGGEIRQGDTLQLKLCKESPAPIWIDLWYPGQDGIGVSLQTPSGKFGPYPPPLEDHACIQAEADEFHLFHNSGSARFHRPSNAKHQIWVEFKGPPGEYAILLYGRKIQDGKFHATIGPNLPAADQPPFNRFLNHLIPGSLWDGATARHNICPGDYVIRTDWKDLDGRDQFSRGQGKPGELWTGSSKGPTFDGRLGVDFCAPGDSVFTAYDPRSFRATFRNNLILDGKGLYGRASAVSASAPFAAGVIALMLQRNPKLDAVQVKKILQCTARADRFTGVTPNPSWGYGKIDAHGAVRESTPAH